MLSSPWTLEQPEPFICARPLGLTEQVFYWDAQFEGTADSIQAAEVEIGHGTIESIASPENVERAWVSLKRQYPLLGSSIAKRENQSLWFIVSEDRLRSCGPGEVQFHQVASPEEASTIASNIPNSPRLLSDDLLACLLVFRRTDTSKRFHVLIYAAHCITDGNANATLLRVFLDKLASPGQTVETWDIHDRLLLSSSSEDLFPTRHLSAALKRWRRAIAFVISTRRLSILHGGHTLPNKITSLTPYQPARTESLWASFEKGESQLIIQACRQLGVTFGVVYPVLGQVALTRLLCRKFVRGEISQDEWDFRKKEPMITGGPLNLRPMLDKEWFEKGGSTNVSVSIGFYYYHLPFMPLGVAANIAPGDPVPSFSDLLSKKRFLYRSHLIQKQADRVLRHPLRLEIGAARLPGRVEFLKQIVQSWRSKILLHNPADRQLLSAQELTAQAPVFGHGGSSFGNTDGLYPEVYPLSGVTPVLRLITTGTTLHCRPKELYLGAVSGRGRLRIMFLFDGNCYEVNLVREFLGEVEGAIRHYLLPKNFPSSHL